MAFAIKRNRNSYFARLSLLKKLFWLYFLLLILEGALRKWIVPQLSAPLLVIRDPVSIMIIWEAYRTRKWPSRWSVLMAVVAIVIIGLFSLQIALGDNPFLVGLYGLRSYLLPFPVIFIMGENLDDEDLLNLGRCVLWLLLPTCLLAVGQYLTPSDSFLNKGAYANASQIAYVGMHVRASGTFSFAIGLVEFATLAGAFVFYGIIREKLAKKWLIWASAFALIVIVPTSGQRTLVVQLAAVLGCVAMSAMMGVSQFVKVTRIIIPIFILFILASFLPVFKDATQSMGDRFTLGASSEGGTQQSALYDRTIRPVISAVDAAGETSNWMGIGLGRGAIAVQAFMTGLPQFVTGEYEFSHELMEMGPLAGSAFSLFKMLLAILIFGQAFARARDHEPLALLFYPLVFSTLFFGLLEQPTVQGFIVISTALCIAAAKQNVKAASPLAEPLLRQRQALLALQQRQQAWRQRRIQRS